MENAKNFKKKTISISAKRQITIPQTFYEELGFGHEAECILQDNYLLIKPIKERSDGTFAEQILADLISQGYNGTELLLKFKEVQSSIRPAVERMLQEASNAAIGEGEFSTYKDIFEMEENE